MTAARKNTAGKAGNAKPVEAAVTAGAEAVETVVKAGAQVAAKGYEKAVAMGREQAETAVKAGAQVAAEGYEKAVAMGREQAETAVKAGAGAFKGYEDLAGFGTDTVDAVMRSGAILATGAQAFNDVWFGLARASVDEAVGAANALFGCKSVAEVVDVQTGLAKARYERFVVDSRRLSDMSAKLAEDAAAPITERVTVAVKTFTKPLAA